MLRGQIVVTWWPVAGSISIPDMCDRCVCLSSIMLLHTIQINNSNTSMSYGFWVIWLRLKWLRQLKKQQGLRTEGFLLLLTDANLSCLNMKYCFTILVITTGPRSTFPRIFRQKQISSKPTAETRALFVDQTRTWEDKSPVQWPASVAGHWTCCSALMTEKTWTCFYWWMIDRPLYSLLMSSAVYLTETERTPWNMSNIDQSDVSHI